MYEPITLPKRAKRNADMGNISYMALLGLKNEYKFPRRLTDKSEMIIETVCDWFGITREEIRSNKRYRRLVEPRQIAMFLLKRYTNLSLKEIGLMFGGRDHTTTIHSATTVENLMQTSEDYRITVQSIEVKIQ